MSLSQADGSESGVDYPRFDHGEDLLILLRGDGRIEFRSDSPQEYVEADNAVTVSDMA